MTEDEAKTKWCPFVRFHIEGKAPAFTVTPNRDQRGTRCIGSACMAWQMTAERYHYRDFPDTAPPEGWEREGDGLVDGEGEYRLAIPPTGYCGLAGAPQ